MNLIGFNGVECDNFVIKSVKSKCIKIVRYMLNNGYYIDTEYKINYDLRNNTINYDENNYKMNLLVYCILSNNPNIVNLLFNKKANTNKIYSYHEQRKSCGENSILTIRVQFIKSGYLFEMCVDIFQTITINDSHMKKIILNHIT